MAVNELISQIQALTIEERKQLLHMIVDTLPENGAIVIERNLLDFRGVGAHLRTKDAQEYVSELRDAWDKRS